MGEAEGRKPSQVAVIPEPRGGGGGWDPRVVVEEGVLGRGLQRGALRVRILKGTQVSHETPLGAVAWAVGSVAAT